ncbi:outer membrane protein transport protein [Vibrio sp. Isolate31]|uniref:outer membrane protein transport protein n=1 Tax=unclassified Vibrio TaxID=2614977 RepID=UPI001EFC65F7|nr:MULTISPECIES: outer membrane protein transport protein [unclassified Vibrio]MCG9554178.1 outer membrane protein transport protein [Vibrio sp. Isolate32]MCG9599944.1 outer membrane protein transport protein [Vibrio sp. Isolate31]
MTTNNTRLFKKSLLAVTITLASSQAMAAGFQLNAQSATGIGRAFAGDAVIADNASVMARNPAAMALFDKTELSLGFESITSMIDVKDAKYCGTTCQVAPTLSPPKDANQDGVGGTSIAPNIHLIVPVNERFAWGINAYTNFGTKTEFSNNYVASEYGGLTDVKSLNFGLAGSYRLNEQWSFGAGLDMIYAQGTMKRTASSDVNGIGGMDLINVDEADGFAVGFNVGTVYELDENNRFGAAYHYSPEFTAKDDNSQKITLPLPDIFEFSGYHKIEDTKFAVHYSVQWIGWSAFDQIDFENLQGSPLGSTYEKSYQWQDGWHYAIGGTYYLNTDWTLRAGYMYDTSAQDSLTSISVPDSDRQWFSAGFTYNIDSKSNIDFGLTYLLGDDVNTNESTPNPQYDPTSPTSPQYLSTLTATTHADAILLGLQYSRSF